MIFNTISALTRYLRAPSKIYDLYRKFVTLHLNSDTTLGTTNNNVFKDSSNNNFALTRLGNVIQGSFSPFGNRWCKYQNSKTDYCYINNNSAVCKFPGDFTLECWIYPTYILTGSCGIMDARTYGGTGANWAWGVDAYTSSGYLLTFFNGTNHTGSNRIPLQTWTHVAVVRTGSTMMHFVNGVLDISYTLTGAINGGSGNIVIGNIKDANLSGYGNYGYMSDLRVVNGTAVYTSTFIPPNGPLTAIPGTALLTFQSNYFKDNGPNNLQIFQSGTPEIKRFSPFQAEFYDAVNRGGVNIFRWYNQFMVNHTRQCKFKITNRYTIHN
jgi:hypothetical protein